MSRYILMPIAQQDLADIREYYLEEAGYRVARQMMSEFVEGFRVLGNTPGAGHKREDLVDDRPILFWPIRDYLVLYKPGTNPVQIITIARGSQDVPVLVGRRSL